MKKIFYLTSFAVLSLCAHAQTITTLAGTVASGYIGDGGPATSAELFHPKGTATDDSGNVYIADADNNVIRKVTPLGMISTIAGLPAGGFSGDGGPAIYAAFSRPNCVVIDHSRNIYICDADNQRIRKIDTAGIVRTIAGDGTPAYLGDGGPATAAELNFPGAIALDSRGNLFITDEYNNRIRKVDTAGVITSFAGNGLTGYPGDPEGADTAAIGFPFGLAIDGADNVYFSLTLDNRVCKMNSAHLLTSLAGVGGGTGGFGGDGGPATAAQFDNPWGIAVDAAGNLYIADNANERIRMVDTGGIIHTIAGTGSAGFSGDGGPATIAKIKDPAGVNVDAAGNIYIADYNNHRIRKINGSSHVLAANETIPAMGGVSLYPNPNNGSFTVRVSSVVNENVTISVTNMAGELVKQLPVATNTAVQTKLDLPAGVYLLSGASGDSKWNRQVVVAQDK